MVITLSNPIVVIIIYNSKYSLREFKNPPTTILFLQQGPIDKLIFLQLQIAASNSTIYHKFGYDFPGAGPWNP